VACTQRWQNSDGLVQPVASICKYSIFSAVRDMLPRCVNQNSTHRWQALSVASLLAPVVRPHAAPPVKGLSCLF
jgi:ABC-type cobalamin transport system ATPase subunit